MPSSSSGHFPLTHYERTKKFKSSNYGTTTTRLSGDTQVAFGHCSLSLAPIVDATAEAKTTGDDDDEATLTTIALVTPSGHLYEKQAIYEYLLTKTAEYKEKLTAYEQQQQKAVAQADTSESVKRQRQEAFDASHKVASKRTKGGKSTGKNSDLVRTSYWLPDMQPDKVDLQHQPPDRPASPYSGDPLRRKDLRELALDRRPNTEDVLCAISGKAIRMQPTVAYWTKDKTKPGVCVLKDVYNMTIDPPKKDKGAAKTDVYDMTIAAPKKDKGAKEKLICPLTNQKIKHTIELKSGGSGFAAHNAVEVKTYKPTFQ